MTREPLRELAACGQSPWVDFIARGFVRNGDLQALVEQGITGVTSNPTIFSAAIGAAGEYDDDLRALLPDERDPKEVFLTLAQSDIRAACDILRPTFDAGRAGRDGWVSLEVDPRLASDASATATEARRLHGLIDRPNLFVKIPATQAGIDAIEETIAVGIPVNVTLLFSIDRHRAAAEAYVRGLHRLADAGGDVASVASVASFFVSRVDTETDRRLDEIGGHDQLRGRLAVANARLAYQTYMETFGSAGSGEWGELASAGARPQFCLWASTSTKNDAYSDVLYVEELIGPDTINTMPPETIRAFQGHGRATATLPGSVDDALRTLDELASAGIDYEDVVTTLEREGVKKFSDSFAELFDTIERKRQDLLAA